MALQMSWQPNLQRRKSGAPPLGLRNLGNTCYLNSVLQCLTYTPPLANFCLRAQHSRLCDRLDGRGEDKNRECPFCILEKRIARSLSIDGPHDAPSKIESCLRLFAEHFQWGRQEDAHEFLRYVIDACHNTCVKLHKAASSANGSGSLNGDKNGEREPRTVVREIFGGALLSQVKCLSCSAESRKTDEIMDISLDLYQCTSLRDALRRFFQPEILDGSNKYSCSSCKRMSEARKQMYILQAPNVLVVQLKRFEGMQGSKINKDVSFEEVLVLSNFMCKASQDPRPEYNLFGSIVHSGYSPESGHYYAYIKDATGRWYCCNDAYVSVSTTQKVLSEKVYILFYLRSNQRSKSATSAIAFNGLKTTDSHRNSTRSGQKLSVNIRQSDTKQNAISCPPNGRGLSKFAKSTGLDASSSFKLSTSLNSPALKHNGPVHIDTDMAAVMKISKVPSRPMVNFTSENMAKREGRKNENGNQNAHAIASTGISISFEQPSIVSCPNVLPSSKFNVKIKVAKDSDNSCGLLSDPLRKIPIDVGMLSSRNGHTRQVQVVDIVDTVMMPLSADGPDLISDNIMDICISGTSVNRRKPGETTVANPPASVSSEVDISATFGTNGNNYFFGGLEKYKEQIAVEASSKLRLCGWFDEVHSFMRDRKRLCAEVDGRFSDKTELKRLLIDDAKKTFTSKLPNSVRQKLIDRLKLLSQAKTLLDV